MMEFLARSLIAAAVAASVAGCASGGALRDARLDVENPCEVVRAQSPADTPGQHSRAVPQHSGKRSLRASSAKHATHTLRLKLSHQTTTSAPGDLRSAGPGSRRSTSTDLHEFGISNVGFEVMIRSGKDDEVWWFDVAPTPFGNQHFMACVTNNGPSEWVRRHGCDIHAHAEAPALITTGSTTDAGHMQYNIALPLTDLAPGIHEVSVRLLDELGKRTVCAVTAHLWVLDQDVSQEEHAARLSDLYEKSNIRQKAWDKEERELWKQRRAIAGKYSPLHPELFKMKPSQMVKPQLMKLLEGAGPAAAVSAFLRPVVPTVLQKVRGEPLPSQSASDSQPALYSFPLLSEEFCRLLMEEVKHAVRLQVAGSVNFTRPNTMNNYGYVTEELGLDLWPLARDVLAPLASLAFPHWGGGSLDSVHAFTISYTMSGDRDLSRHMDQVRKQGPGPGEGRGEMASE